MNDFPDVLFFSMFPAVAASQVCRIRTGAREATAK
jgi:hypothetical protein